MEETMYHNTPATATTTKLLICFYLLDTYLGCSLISTDWDSHEDTPERSDEAPSRFYANDQNPTWEQDSRQTESIIAENSDLRRDLHRIQKTSIRLLDAQKESAERIRELQDNNYGLEEEVADMRPQLSFATGTIINEIQDKVDTATVAGSTVRALKERIVYQTDTIQQLKTKKKRIGTELSQLRTQKKSMGIELSQLQRQIREYRESSKVGKIKKGKSGHHSASSGANAATTTVSPITAPGQAPALAPSAHEHGPYLVENVIRDRLIRDEHLTSGVKFQFQEALSKGSNEGRNVYGFIHRGKIGCYYCFHEVCEKGPDASVELHLADTRCQFGSDKCNFLVKAVVVGSHRKLQIYNCALVTFS
ncbi:hypothetical protein DER46DRAFT_654602 [Fusarium sp. MPI-SDFR-AT-0072]|uniref:Uncharacterized protein n=1 Tax=Fusarium oxysporum f. sp. rapae TaxID=485398 RepID=A0A8J5UEI1_FUSOX|nr:hypothetical protein Forpe1208_v005218 [Fusarium oxysporum f. sp. rapae]KAH7177344.1 hypothetical protein DER46DRAFT_654602 [Fusarium sp. MPI-SDFR-AT-0072]KAI7765920.1 hypothetical protein LZL87_001033 [Fusarium oxysporum]